VRITFLASGPPGETSAPDRDFAVPFALPDQPGGGAALPPSTFGRHTNFTNWFVEFRGPEMA
jgi:hypothetical protein